MKKKKRMNPFRILWYFVLGFLIVGYIITPFVYTFIQSFETEAGYGFEVFMRYFSNLNQRQVISNTILLGILSVITCGFLGIILSLYMTFLVGKWKKLTHILLLSPMMIPGVIIVISFIQIYGESGILTKAIQYLFHMEGIPFNFQGVGAIIFVITYTQYVYFYLNVYVALKYVDNSSVEAARSMGASWFQIFRDIIWPVITPAVLTSVVITFVSGISAYSAPNLIGGGFKVLSTQIVRSKANNQMALASVQVVVLFVISVAVMILIQYYGKHHEVHSMDRSTEVRPILGKRSLFISISKIVVLIQIVLIMIPIIAIVYLSFTSTSAIMQDVFPHDFTLENYVQIFEKSRVLKPLLNSLNMSVMSVVAGLIITIPSAYMIVKFKRKSHQLLRLLLMLPWAMPSSVVAINLINAFSQKSFFAFGGSLIGGFYIVPIAYTITSIPLLLSSNEVAIIAPGIMAGGVLAFIRTIGEYTMSALLYGVYNRPISISMVTNMQEYRVGISLAYGVIVIVICYIALASVFKLDKKRIF